MNKKEKILTGGVILGLVSLLPIWRAGIMEDPEKGLDLWEYFQATHQEGSEPFPYPHIPYAEALRRAREAYEKVRG